MTDDTCPVCGNSGLARRGGRHWCTECGYVVKEPEPSKPLPGYA